MKQEQIDNIREFINIRLYNNKVVVLRLLQILSILVSVIAILTIIYYHGFPETKQSIHFTYIIISGSFWFYIFKFFIKIFYDFHPIDYIRKNWFEGTIMLVVFLDSISKLLFGEHIVNAVFLALNMPHFTAYYILFIQFYLFIIVAIEIAKASQHIAIFRLGPSALLSMSFILIITVGGLLLFMPEMTVAGHIRFIDAFFTSTSACCVTGLTCVDTVTTFSLKGKIIIMILIQLGGINIISFATFFATFYRDTGLRYQSILKDLVTTDQLSDTRNILRRIVFFSVLIEFIGATALFFTWGSHAVFHNLSEKVFFSVFHSVSAFNNAGFALFTDNLYDVTIRHSYMLQMVIASLIFFGGLGFIAMQDIFGFSNIRTRIKIRWKKLMVGTKVALFTSFILIISGAVLFYFLERNGAARGYSPIGAIVISIFQSVTTRTAGFNSVDFSRLGQPILIFMMLLMFVGASPGSTGGGIKTTTFAVIVKSAISTIRGKKNVEILKHSISTDLIDKSYSIALFSITLIFISAFILSITESNFGFLNLLFEEVSAFGTVGLSTGITSGLSDIGKIIIITSMYVGRIGTLTLALALTKKAFYTKYYYPKVNMMVG
jgi:trk system potassium uptake protein